MSVRVGEVDRFAGRFILQLGDPAEFRSDAAAAVRNRFDITVTYRDDAGGDCDIDGSYNHDSKEIVCAAAASPGRRRFTILHELAHALGRSDAEFADWLFGLARHGRRERNASRTPSPARCFSLRALSIPTSPIKTRWPTTLPNSHRQVLRAVKPCACGHHNDFAVPVWSRSRAAPSSCSPRRRAAGRR